MQRVLAIMEDLAMTAGPQARPCGDTAEATELALGPFDTTTSPVSDLATPSPGVVFRVHMEVDADNGCFDHVLFVTRGPEGRPCVLDSYIDVRGPWCRIIRDPAWLPSLCALEHLVGDPAALSAAWQYVCALDTSVTTTDTYFRGPVRNVSMHIARATPFRSPRNHSLSLRRR